MTDEIEIRPQILLSKVVSEATEAGETFAHKLAEVRMVVGRIEQGHAHTMQALGAGQIHSLVEQLRSTTPDLGKVVPGDQPPAVPRRTGSK